MSIDYQFYLAPLPYTSVMTSIDFRTLGDREHVVQGEIGNSGLMACLVKNPAPDEFSREELQFSPTCQLILSPDLGNYEHSMSALIATINQLVPVAKASALYMNNELLLLDKLDNQTTLYTSDKDWWDEHIENIRFPHSQR